MPVEFAMTKLTTRTLLRLLSSWKGISFIAQSCWIAMQTWLGSSLSATSQQLKRRAKLFRVTSSAGWQRDSRLQRDGSQCVDHATLATFERAYPVSFSRLPLAATSSSDRMPARSRLRSRTRSRRTCFSCIMKQASSTSWSSKQ
jgi:hypothetical protein